MIWEAVAWVGTALIIASRFSFIGADLLTGFACAAAGSVCWCLYGYHKRIWSLVAVDGVMLVMDIYGTFKWS